MNADAALTEAMDCAGRANHALAGVMDPCSVGLGRPVSIVDLGLVVAMAAADRTVRLVLCSTGPGCLLMPRIMESCDAVLRMAGFEAVEVLHDPTFFWTPDRMSAVPASSVSAADKAPTNAKDVTRPDRQARLVTPRAWASVGQQT